MPRKSGKMKCDACGKLYEVLGRYGDCDWWVCWRCFDKADRLSYEEDRWPDIRDFEAVKKLATSLERTKIKK
jgi:hypothetical protein